MKKYCIIALLLMAFGCRNEAPQLRTGDLIFVGIPQDYSLEEGSMGDAISEATGDGELNLIHVAIAEVQGDSTWIIDATIRHGVDRHPLDTFLCDFTLKDGSLPVFIVKRLPDTYDPKPFVEKAKSFCGQPYDVHFLPDNGALYCSELVKESYRSCGTLWLFGDKPMNFRNKDGEIPQYWTQLFALLGEEVPQDVPGTNPQDMAASPLLVTVSDDYPLGR